MADWIQDSYSIEPERYELFEKPIAPVDLTRRDFFKILGGGLLIVSLYRPGIAAIDERERRFAAGRQEPEEIGAWLHIGSDGVVTVYAGKAEVGQNIATSLAQVVAEELPLSFDSIRMVLGDTDLTPYDRGTFGSRTTPATAPILRRAAAAARETLLDLAAEAWGAPRGSLKIDKGKIINPQTGKESGYGDLTQGKELMKTISGDAPTKPADEWTVAGQSIHKIDGKKFVTGSHRYSSDIQLPNMLYGKILRPSKLNAALANADTSKAEAMEGVKVVRDGDFIGVAAKSERLAAQAIEAIDASWNSSPQISNDELFEHLKMNASDSDNRRRSGDQTGDIDQGLSQADVRLEQTYTIAYIAHVPLEPRAAAAIWENGKLTVWVGTQRPFGVQEQLCDAFRLPKEKVRVIMPDTGSGYGGKHTVEAAIEAARLAHATQQPVKVVWTREEEFTWAYFRPAGVIEIKSGATKEGKVTAWEFHNYNSGSSAIRPMYDFPNQRIEFHSTQSPLRQGSYRCLAATANHFARESHIDELAHAVGMDPLDFRLKNINDDRFKGVLTAAAERFGWPRATKTENRGYGIAVGFEKNSYVATCAEIEIDKDKGIVRVVRVVESFDCGAILNPDHLNNQIEGMIMMGLGGALFEEIKFRDGKILNPRLSQYPVPRFRDLPDIETVLINRKDIPSAGAGETPIVGIAPAVGNAIFDATGIRIRSLPMAANGIKAML